MSISQDPVAGRFRSARAVRRRWLSPRCGRDGAGVRWGRGGVMRRSISEGVASGIKAVPVLRTLAFDRIPKCFLVCLRRTQRDRRSPPQARAAEHGRGASDIRGLPGQPSDLRWQQSGAASIRIGGSAGRRSQRLAGAGCPSDADSGGAVPRDFEGCTNIPKHVSPPPPSSRSCTQGIGRISVPSR
jgi:hypothetical protein